jgi:GxxExxY protein
MLEDELSNVIIGAAIEVHKAVGPGLLESVYQKCLTRELQLAGVGYQEEVVLPLQYKGMEFDGAFRLDMLIADKVIVELKAVEAILPVHEAQLLSYLRLTNRRLGLLINFNVPVLRAGIRRVVNNL